MTVAGVLLAAGAGRRYGGPKALVRDADGTSWVRRRARTLLDGGCSPVVVVTGASPRKVAAELTGLDVVVVRATYWEEGMGASLRTGIAASAVDALVEAVLVALVDTPGLTGQVVERLVALGSGAVLAQASYAGAPGHPVVIGRDHWDGVLAVAEGDRGARDYLREREVQLVECDDVGDGRDVDVATAPADLTSPGIPPAYAGPMTEPVPDGDRPAPDAEHPALAGRSTYTPDASRTAEPARSVLLADVTREPVDVAAHSAAVAMAAAGAVVTFAGVVRDHDHGRSVTSIEYVAHPSAGRIIGEVAAGVAAAHPVDAVAVSHRVGELAVGDCALAVAVSAAHRREAFDAASDLVEQVKARLPVWKRQVFDDGSDEWVSCP